MTSKKNLVYVCMIDRNDGVSFVDEVCGTIEKAQDWQRRHDSIECFDNPYHYYYIPFILVE